MESAIQQFLRYLRIERNASELTIKSYSEDFGSLQEFLHEQVGHGVERVSIPGWIVGSVRLFTGQEVPVIHPVLRGMYSWTTNALVGAVCGKPPPTSATRAVLNAYAEKSQAVANFLKRIYELRNLGLGLL